VLTGGPLSAAAEAALNHPVHSITLPPLSLADATQLAADRTAGGAPPVALRNAEGLPALIALVCRHPDAADLAAAAAHEQATLHPAEARLVDLIRAAEAPVRAPEAAAAADAGAGRRARVDGAVASGLVRLVPAEDGLALALPDGPLGRALREGQSPSDRAGARRRLEQARETASVDAVADKVRLRLAASTALDAGAAHQAVALHERLLRLMDEQDPDRWQALSGKGAALGAAGRPAAAAIAIGRAADLLARTTPDALVLPALRRAAAEQGLRAGRVPDGLDRLAAALDDAGLSWPASPMAALAGLIWARLRLRARGLRPAAPAADLDLTALARVDTCWTAALGLCWVDSIRSAVFQSRYALMALALGEPSRVMRALSTEAAFMANEGGAANRRRAAQALDDARGLAAAHPQDPTGGAIVEICASAAAFFSADFALARALAEGARRRLEALPQALTWEGLNCDVFGLWAQAWLGDLGGLRALLEARLADASDRGDLLAAATLSVGLPSLAWLADDRPDLAQARADEAMALWSHQGGFHTQHWMNLTARVQVALYRVDGVEAWRLVSQTWPDLKGAQMLRLQYIRMDSHFLRARAGLAALAAGAAGGGVRRTVARDARTLRGEDVPLGDVLGLAVMGGLAHVEGRSDDAQRWLGQAQAAAEQAGLLLLAQAARVRRGGEHAAAGTAALRAAGVVAPARMVGVFLPG
jgi:eukaryotic-like serine/threonine-protein kinase